MSTQPTYVYTLETEDYRGRSDDGVLSVHATLEGAQAEAADQNAYGSEVYPLAWNHIGGKWKDETSGIWEASPAESDLTWRITKRELRS